MIDLHCHLLPGVDDGAHHLEEALEMCRLAAADGCRVLVATPHLRHEHWANDDRDHLESRWQQLRLAARGIIDVRLGGEIAVSSQSARELEQLPAGNLLTLAGSRYLLLELHHQGLGPDPLELVHELRVEGWQPVLAHPERIPWLARDYRLLDELVDSGAHLQLTAMCVLGRLGGQVRELCSALLEDGLVSFIASDAHGVKRRPPGLSDAFGFVAANWGESEARRIFIDNPTAVLEDRPLPANLAVAESEPSR